MTNAIEQSKREMYESLKFAWEFISPYDTGGKRLKKVEEALESYLELLRQDLSALHETARKRFEDIQSLEQANRELGGSLASVNNTIQICARHSLNTIRDLEERLANMTAERDHLRNRQQASEHAQGEASEKGATPHQSSEENASCANSGGHTAILVTAIDLCKRQVELWGFQEVKAKKAMRRIARVVNGDPDLANALRAASSSDGYGAWFINNTNCMHSFHPAFPGGEQCVFCGVGK